MSPDLCRGPQMRLTFDSQVLNWPLLHGACTEAPLPAAPR
jgi:hypothetical protein